MMGIRSLTLDDMKRRLAVCLRVPWMQKDHERPSRWASAREGNARSPEPACESVPPTCRHRSNPHQKNIVAMVSEFLLQGTRKGSTLEVATIADEDGLSAHERKPSF